MIRKKYIRNFINVLNHAYWFPHLLLIQLNLSDHFKTGFLELESKLQGVLILIRASYGSCNIIGLIISLSSWVKIWQWYKNPGYSLNWSTGTLK